MLSEKYTVRDLLYLIMCIVRTKVFYPSARIIRFPFDVRGKRHIQWGKRLTTGKGCRIEAIPQGISKVTLTIGDDVQLNDYVHITAMESVSIGNNVLLASKIYISDCTHGSYSGGADDSDPTTPPIKRAYTCKPVVVEDNVWIGEFVSILPGVTIGVGSIIGANSVVTKNIPPYVIAVGAPALPIKKYNFETKKWEKI